MEAVSANAAIGDLRRKGESLCQGGLMRVESGIEAADLDNMGRGFKYCPDRRQVVRLMQRRKWNQLLELGQHLGIEPNRSRECQAAMYDAMSDGIDMAAAEMGAQELQ